METRVKSLGNSLHEPIHFRLLVEDILHFILAAQEDGRPLGNGHGHEIQPRVSTDLDRGQTTRVLHDVRHRKALVDHPQHSAQRIRGRWVHENAAVLNGPVDISHNRADVPDRDSWESACKSHFGRGKVTEL